MGLQVLVSYLFIIITTRTVSASDELLDADVHKLPYWIQDSLLEYADEIGNRNLTEPIRKIYRKDINPDYAAYYEFQFEDWCMTFSAGPKTGDHRVVDEKKIPRITDILIAKAAEVNKICFKFIRLSADGTTICEDAMGNPVASTMNLRTLTKDVNITTLPNDISESLTGFQEVWDMEAKEIRSSYEWKDTNIYGLNETRSTKQKDTIYKVLHPGDSQDIPIGTSNVSEIEITARVIDESSSGTKKKLSTLCRLLGDICSKGSEVNVSKILRKKKNLKDLNYIEIDVSDDYELLMKQLKKRDIDFYFKLTVKKKFVVIRRFTIKLSHKRSKRSSWSGFSEYSISYENLMPNYDQHICCGGCYSGCVPVAWAQVFAYYDTVAHTHGYRYSTNHWRGEYGNYGDPSKEAPDKMNWRVRKYVEALRHRLRTKCMDGQGVTEIDDIDNVDGWFRYRQGSGRVISLSKSGIREKISKYIKRDYPVVIIFLYKRGKGTKKKASGHAAVVTKIKEKSRQYKSCRKVGWWFGRRTKCNWKTEYDYEWYRRMGWGDHEENGWKTGVTAYGAFVAVV